jgi:SAM-dependent methyltransferase
VAVPAPASAPAPSTGVGSDDWYLRRGRFARGPALDLAWHAELDEVTAWLDDQPLTGSIVELAAGSGWWSPLLASKGELSVYDASPEALDRARERLVAHRLRAHLHVRDPWAEPDRPVDGVVLATTLWHLDDHRADAALALAGRWLRPGGRLVVIEPRPDPMTGPVDAATDVTPDPAIPDRDAGWLDAALPRAGLRPESLRATSRFFLLGAAVRPA